MGIGRQFFVAGDNAGIPVSPAVAGTGLETLRFGLARLVFRLGDDALRSLSAGRTPTRGPLATRAESRYDELAADRCEEPGVRDRFPFRFGPGIPTHLDRGRLFRRRGMTAATESTTPPGPLRPPIMAVDHPH